MACGADRVPPPPPYEHRRCGTVVASLLRMRTATKLILLGSAIGAAAMLGRRHRARQSSDEPGLRGGPVPAPDAGDADRGTGDPPLPIGISEVDPQPLTQISAEGIDPDLTRAAHEEPREQRERLAGLGQNLPRSRPG